MINLLNKALLKELIREYPDTDYFDSNILIMVLTQANSRTTW